MADDITNTLNGEGPDRHPQAAAQPVLELHCEVVRISEGRPLYNYTFDERKLKDED